MSPVDWNDRYSAEEFIYGTDPNEFLADHASQLRGPVLSLAEGEVFEGTHHPGLASVVQFIGRKRA